MKVGIINSGYGNILSIRNMLKRIEVDPILIEAPEDFKHCTKIILPGVGSFDRCILSLKGKKLDSAIKEWAEMGQPILGICVGAQVLGHSSEEGQEQGLGLLPMRTIKFDPHNNLPIPHMSWNTLQIKNQHYILRNLDPEHRFYFVHSYYFDVDEPSLEIAHTNYGNNFVSVAANSNIIAVQFHPEKSQRHGMNLLQNFVSYVNE